jgi:uncharacterized membrane protein required for colicin V production
MIFDFLVLILMAAAMYFGLKNGTHPELYRIGRVFLGMTIASVLGTPLGWKLTSWGVLAANNKAIVSLVGFLVLFSLYWVITIFLVKWLRRYALQEHKMNNYLGLVSNGIIALLVITFASFISTQLSFAKDGYKAYLRDKSFSYIYMDRLCRKAITADVVDEITGGGAGQKVVDNLNK